MRIVKYLLLQILIGVVLNGGCFAAAMLTQNQNLYFNWTSVGGFVLMLIGGIGFMGGSRRGDVIESRILHTSITDIRKRPPSTGSAVKYALLLIGLINVVLPGIVYSFMH